MEFAYKKSVKGEYAVALGAVEQAIAAHGFVIAHVHDIQATLAQKGFEISPLRIYEVSCPGQQNGMPAKNGRPRLALLMPCRINVYQEGQKVVVCALRSVVFSKIFPEAGLEEDAEWLDTEMRVLVDAAIAAMPKKPRKRRSASSSSSSTSERP